MDAPVYVLTSDKYLPALRPFAFLLNKYWRPAPQVIVGGFTPPEFPLPANFSFYSIGKFADYPVDRWSNSLIRFLLEQPHDVFVFMLEDYWITRPVQESVVQVAVDYMRQFEYVARFDLTGDRLHSGFAKDYGKAGDVDLIISDPESQYHCSLMAGAWRRSHMLKTLVENETPWQTELSGTPRLRSLKDNLIVLGTKQWPIKHTLAMRKGDAAGLHLKEISPADVSQMRAEGLLAPWEGGPDGTL
jgi:hypothetical protein